MLEPFRLTASQALALMQKGDLTVEDYAKSLLSRIKARDDVVKAWAYLDPEYVLAQARKLDQIPPEERGPLHGVPIGVKDVILTKDMPTGYNSAIYKDVLATVDAGPIIALRAAGAMIFGKTATAEFAVTRDGPPTRNPHDPTRTPGGSSSGSGASVADYQVPVALGTQTVGSVVRPASFNGVYAFKPTWGSISREGLAQYSISSDTLGLFARSVEDIQLLSGIFQLADDEPVPASPFELDGAKVAFLKTSLWSKAGPGTRDAWAKGQEILSKHGAHIEEIELPEHFAKIPDWHINILSGEGRVSFLGNYLLAKDKLHKALQDDVENVTKISRKMQLESYDGVAALRPVWDSIAQKYDAIITPSASDEPPIGTLTGDPAFCSTWSALGVPQLNLPGFAGENGMPIGLGLVGARYDDLHVLHAGKAIGEVFEAEGGFESKVL
ncbi:hypothetical protein N7486_004205 [Penicillium sp. IBT 16267x]|nr:hypothetical protein N7486_004205 [Penicillium sp. IBT 16267x]